MSRRRASMQNRCPRCQIHRDFCFCELIPSIETKTKVSIIMHIKEKSLTSNTGRIANLALMNSKIYIRGNVEDKDFSKVYTPDSRYKQLFLYPCESSIPLTKEYLNELNTPVELVIPDATWNQAKKFYKREPIFTQMQAVHLPQNYKTKYHLRAQKYEYGVCTLEAIAYALKEIEGPTSCEQLLQVLKVMDHRTLVQRQKIKPSKEDII